MNKRFISILIALSMVVSIMPMFTFSTWAEDNVIEVNIDLQKAITTVSSGSTIKLTADITENIVIPAEKEITLDLNGFVLKALNSGCVVSNSGILIIKDSNASTIRYFKDSKCAHGVDIGGACNNCGVCTHGVALGRNCDTCGEVELSELLVDTCFAKADGCYETYVTEKPDDMTGVLTIHGGCITGGVGTTECESGGVTNNGELILEAGNIIGNCPADKNGCQGGGVSNSGTFVMNSGSIIGNCSYRGGGGVFNYGSATFTMNDGSISYNTAKESGGGVGNDGTIKINGGSINNNTAGNIGGGVYVSGKNPFTIPGTSIQVYIGGGSSYIGGTAKIFNNTGIKGNNLVAFDNNPFAIGDSSNGTDGNGVFKPSAGMNVYVTLLASGVESSTSGAITTNGAIDDVQYFHSDSDLYDVCFVEGDDTKDETDLLYNDHLELIEKTIYYVNVDGDNSKDGLSQETAVKTISCALGKADTKPATIILCSNIEENVSISKNKTISLDLNGKILKAASEGCVIANEGRLVIYDSDVEATTHTINYFNYKKDSAWTYISNPTPAQETVAVDIDSITDTTTVVKVKGGIITGGTGETVSDTHYGGGIYNCNFISIKGGNIVGNSSYFGGGIYNDYKGGNVVSLSMTGGCVVGNYAQIGGGVYIFDSSTCLAEGTLISMADDSIKKVEDIVEGDIVKTFNHETGTISSSRVYLNYKSESLRIPFTLHFDDELSLTLTCGHSLLEKSSRKYVQLSESNAREYIGNFFYGEDCLWHELLSVTTGTEPKHGYMLYTAYHVNAFANGMLQATPDVDCYLNFYELDDNLKADKVQLEADIQKYGLLEYDELKKLFDVNETYFNETLAKYTYIIIGKGLVSEEYLQALMAETEAENILNVTPEDKKDKGLLMSSLSGEVELKKNKGESIQNDTSSKGSSSIGAVTIGGSAKITNNSNNNLYLFSGKYINIGIQPRGMKVGVTLGAANGSGVFTSNGSEIDKQFFFSDSDDFIVKFNTNHLELARITVKVAEDINHGTVTVNNQDATTGTAVTVTATPNSGYTLDTITVKDTDETDISVSNNQFTMPDDESKLPVTVSATFKVIERRHSSDSSSLPTITVPVSGDKGTVKVSATVSGNNATIKNVSSYEIAQVGTGDYVVIDLTSLNSNVTGVTIPKNTFENVISSDAKGLEIRLPNGMIAIFDKAALAAVVEQAMGLDIKLVVERDINAENTLNAVQKLTVREMNNPVVIDAYFTSNGQRISDFKGGKADIIATYETTNPVRVWYVAEDGSKELVSSTFDGKLATFTITHFSHYVIEILEEASYITCPQDDTCVYAKFTDANTKEWYHDGVHYCVEEGYMNGMSNTQFAPSNTLSRAMIVTMLWRYAGSPVVDYAMSFNDVNEDEWFTEPVRWAQSTGVVTGYDEKTFGPSNNVTREQLAAILYRYAQQKGKGFTGSWMYLLNVSDRANISSWANESMHWVYMKHILSGYEDGTLRPTGNATRAEAACMLQRFCNIMEE